MLPLLIILIALGTILEAISLRRDPEKVELDYTISSGVTEPGAIFKIQSVVTNKSRIPISYLAIKELFPSIAEIPDRMTSHKRYDGTLVENIFRIRGRQRKKLTLETSIDKRGVYIFKGDSLKFGDFLGFREVSKTIFRQQEVVVYPEILESPSLTDALASFYGDIAAKRYLIRDPILTIGCREYTGREPMKDIHWLQSARHAELMVREFEYNRQMSVNVILSVEGINISDDEGLDKCCAAARAICEELVKKSVPVNFFTNSLLQHKGSKGIWKCEVSSVLTGGLLEGLGRVSSHACSTMEKLLEYAIRDNDSAASFIVIVHESGKHCEESIDRLRRATGQEVMLVRIGNHTEEIA